MDKTHEKNGPKYLDRAIDQLKRHGLELAVQKDAQLSDGRIADAALTVSYGGRKLRCIAEVKRHLRPSTLGSAVHQIRSIGERALLVADYVTPSIAERLHEQGIWFADTAGNVYLEDAPLYIYVVGRDRPKDYAETKSLRAFQPSGLQVLFALLCNKNLVRSPYREIAKFSGVSHGTVGWVVAELSKLGYMTEYKNRRALLRYDALVSQWAEHFSRTLRPKLTLARYKSSGPNWWKGKDFREFGYKISGEVAAAELVGQFRPATMTFYGYRVEPDFLKKNRLIPDKNGDVELLEKFWDFSTGSTRLVPPLLIFADLLATGEGRCIELAETVREECLSGSA
jgi:hypothetical protein